MKQRLALAVSTLALASIVAGCVRPAPQGEIWLPSGGTIEPGVLPGSEGEIAATRDPNRPLLTPTPDAPRVLPTIRLEEEQYTIAAGDALGKIAQRFGITLSSLIEVNGIENADLVSPGQEIIIPAPVPLPTGPAMKIIPDSELVRGPASADFDTEAFISEQGGFLSSYTEEVDERTLTGAQIIDRISREYSVNPRLLLAVLDYQSGWVTEPDPDEAYDDFPIAYPESWRKGLYLQLAFAANTLNRGYYLWKLNVVSHWLLADGAVVPPDASINAGTAAVQNLMAALYRQNGWAEAVREGGLLATYQRLFGYPFDYTVEPLLPDSLSQPPMQLPFEDGPVWYFSGGPHAGWGDGSGWAALDFAPPEEPQGCVLSPSWVTAVADGVVTYSDFGTVLLDLDGDGFDQTGWTVLYLHIDSSERIEAGSRVQAGDRIGHASCEGGVSNGTHVHMARRYNGEWIAADQDVPFNLDGWVSEGSGSEYNGQLLRDEQTVEAWDRRTDENRIWR